MKIKTLFEEVGLDDDLEKILNDLWKKKPYPTVDYCKIKVMCLIVQELRKKKVIEK